jgi:hypothetical protein
MTPLRVAVLEDDKAFLKEMVDNLKRTELVKIVVAEQHSDKFMEQVKEQQPEALLLDILLNGESINGIQVAQILKLPVMFLSGARKEFLDTIDNLKTSETFPPVEEVGKIPDADKLKSLLKKFIPRVREYQKNQKVKLKPIGDDEMFITPSEVSFILAENGNHKIYFVNRKPIEIADKTFDYFKQNGFPEEKFYKFGKSYLLNITLTTFEEEKLLTPYMLHTGEKKIEKQKVPTDKRREIKNVFLK